MKTPAFLFILTLATNVVIAGESPYNPGAKPAARPDPYYVCVATSRDFTTRYVSGVGAAPKPYAPGLEGTISMAWTEHLKKTVGVNRTMYESCSIGSQAQMQSYRESEIDPKRYKKIEQVDWKYSPAG
jgi:hypothetical protein